MKNGNAASCQQMEELVDGNIRRVLLPMVRSARAERVTNKSQMGLSAFTIRTDNLSTGPLSSTLLNQGWETLIYSQV